MTVEVHNTKLQTFEGNPRVALDDGAKAQVNRDIENARTQFTAAVESLIRTEKGENTVAGGSASITGFGTNKLSAFNFISHLLGTGDELTASRGTTKPPGRGR